VKVVLVPTHPITREIEKMILRLICGFVIILAGIWFVPEMMYNITNDGGLPADATDLQKAQRDAYADKDTIPSVEVNLGAFTAMETVVPNFIESLFGASRTHYVITEKGSFEISRRLDGSFDKGFVTAIGLGDNRLTPKLCIESKCASLITKITTDNDGNKIVVNENEFVAFQINSTRIIYYFALFAVFLVCFIFIVRGGLS